MLPRPNELLTIISFIILSKLTPTNAISTSSPTNNGPKPIDGSNWPDRFPAKNHCSRCGLCETSFVSKVTDSCAFLGEGMKRMDSLETKVHGRARNVEDLAWTSDKNGKDSNLIDNDEGRFGVMERPMMLGKGVGIPHAQWTGCVTGIAVSMLESGLVDAVVCIASKSDQNDDYKNTGWSEPEPILAKTADEVLRGRGVKPALAPSLKVLDEIKNDDSIEKLLFCGVGCAVQAFRAVQDDLNLKEVYVLGTNCADNSPTPQAARNFISKGLQVDPNNVQGYEFMQDFRVHVKVPPSSSTENSSSSYIKKPYFCLPGTVAKSAIAESCLACFDYTNGLADVVIGYMAAPLDGNNGGQMDQSLQSITVRNSRGMEMIEVTKNAGRLYIQSDAKGSGSHETISLATVESDSIVMEMTGRGKVPEKGMPRLMGEVMASVMGTIGPKGVNFARYSIDYHVLRNYLHILDEWGEKRVKRSMPKYAEAIVEKYLEDEKFAVLKESILSKKKRLP